MTKENEECYRKYNIFRFVEKNIESDKARDHCHLTEKYRVPAHSKCSIKVTQDKCNFIPFMLPTFTKYDCHMFFKKLVAKKNDKANFDIIPQTSEEYISVTYGCNRFIDSYRFLSISLGSLVKTLVDNSHKRLKDFKEEIFDNDELKFSIEEDRYNNDSIKDLKKDYPDKIEKLGEAVLIYMVESDLKI